MTDRWDLVEVYGGKYEREEVVSVPEESEPQSEADGESAAELVGKEVTGGDTCAEIMCMQERNAAAQWLIQQVELVRFRC